VRPAGRNRLKVEVLPDHTKLEKFLNMRDVFSSIQKIFDGGTIYSVPLVLEMIG
jgi:hypothetical protein